MNLRKLLPELLSDEAAFHLVEFLSQLTSTVESHYFAQMRRYVSLMEQQDLRVNQSRDGVEWGDDKAPF